MVCTVEDLSGYGDGSGIYDGGSGIDSGLSGIDGTKPLELALLLLDSMSSLIYR